MNSLKDDSVKLEVIRLRQEGKSISEISNSLLIGRSTVGDFVSKVSHKAWWERYEDLESNGGIVVGLPYYESKVEKKLAARILVLDIETKYLLLEGWQMFNQNFSVDQIAEDWSILSYSAKWFDSDDVIYSDITEKTEDDILQELHNLLSEADFVVAHNGKRFDLKKIRARMITRGFKPYSPVRIIDTLEIAKTEFAFTSNKLLYLTRILCKKTQKSDHGKFAGHLLWKEFLKGNPEAIEEMRLYNIIDVVSLQELFTIMAPWSSKLPNLDIYEDVISKDEWEESGYVFTNLAKYVQYQHKVTGQFRRGRTNLLTRSERSALLANIG